MKRLIVLIFTAGALFAQVDQFQLLIARGLSLDHFGDYPGAIKTFREALALAEQRQLGDWAQATTLNSLAMSYDEMGQPAEAMHLYRRSLALIEKVKGKNGIDYATVLGNLAADYSHTGQPAVAETLLRETLRIFEAATPRDEIRLAITQSILAPIVLASGKWQEGEQLLLTCIATLEKTPGNERQLPAALNNLGVLRREQKRFGEAADLFRKTVQVLEGEYGPDHTKLIQALNNLALVMFESGHPTEAGPLMERAMVIADKGRRTEHKSYGALLLNYAQYLRKTGRKSEAKQYERQGKDVITNAARSNGVGQTVDVLSFRGR